MHETQLRDIYFIRLCWILIIVDYVRNRNTKIFIDRLILKASHRHGQSVCIRHYNLSKLLSKLITPTKLSDEQDNTGSVTRTKET